MSKMYMYPLVLGVHPPNLKGYPHATGNGRLETTAVLYLITQMLDITQLVLLF